ncbi:MAG: aminoglycoside phosphotransferase family protein [Thermomonas sp.]
MSEPEAIQDANAPDPRADARTAWTRQVLGDPDASPARASMDAGFRSYWRVQAPGAADLLKSVIVMDSPPDKEDVRPWLRIRDLLESGGVRVPSVLAQDLEAGFLLLEDLGADTYLHVIDSGNADVLFDQAITQLLKLQAITPPDDLPAYDEAMLARELRLFDEWFCGHHLGMNLDRDDLQALDDAYRFLIDSALAQPQVLVHRDFMPRNLMPVQARNGDGGPDGPAVLDFQDAVRGPIAYDALSLFKDAFLSWPTSRVTIWLQHYHARATEAGLPVAALAQFMGDAELIGVQRHLKVIGIFARLQHRDGKPKYLADVPRFFGYLDEVLPHYPELQELQRFIAHKVKPAIEQLQAVAQA